ncbi:alpha/beta hydrolase [Gordonia jinhuaensis]|uniref:Hydrolase/esterase/lipase n=1 Tax=Gordonia jinhuaensis TaxID=1517702 RepID=A0A916T8V3_9ACTN|nr:alpha/beta hydrolase [Gordonia jinhuaensis]GGB36021.1 putative hydrolase/esterase/lipase [Gordonia jinhuaensis]
MPVISHRHPSLSSYPLWMASRLVLKPLLTLWPINGPGLHALRYIDAVVALGPRPDGVVLEQMELANRPVELAVPTGPSNRDSDAAVLYMHGGAFVAGGLATHRTVATHLSRRVGLPVYSLAYRQLPEAGVGTSVIDAVEAYAELVNDRGFRHVVVAGDSAGGFLAAKIVEAAAERGLRTPTALIGYSPLLDLDLADNPDRSSRSDAYLPKSKMKVLAPEFDRGPLPMSGVRRINDLPAEIFPPTLLFSAENEMLEPDMVALVEDLDAAGAEATLHSFSWQVHAFPAFAGRHPESGEAIELTAEFVRESIRAAKSDDSDPAVRGRAG